MKKILPLIAILLLCKTTNAVNTPHFTGKPEAIFYSNDDRPDLSQLPSLLSQYGLKPSQSLTLLNKESDKLGMVHYRYIENNNNIPVAGTMWLVHTRNGKIESMNGVLYADIPAADNKAITEKAAWQSAISYTNAKTYYTTSTKVDLYWVLADSVSAERGFHLCYRFDIYASSPLSRNYLFVDVSSGRVIMARSLLDNGNAIGSAVTAYSGTQTITTDNFSGSYRLRETGRGGGIETYNMQGGTSYGAAIDFTDADNNWNNVNAQKDQYATDAQWGAEVTYDFYLNTFNRNSVDNAGFKLRNYVHYSVGYLNAYWDGYEMTYGDGCCGAAPLTALDIIGHEISHGVTQHTAGLNYLNESGALNESYSDCMGTCIEFYGKPGSANWLIGENIGFAFRNMANPKQYQQPNTYKGQYWYTGNSDNGGVHTNSGVMNYWFYLISVGGSGTNDLGNTYNITGITMAEAGAITYRMQSVYLFPTAQYADARTWSIQAATDLYGKCSQEVVTVTNAWFAVGVDAASTESNESVSIAPNTGSAICTGTTVTFTATPVNGGATPSCQWKVNGINVGANSATYTTASLANNDVVTCTLTSSMGCVFPNPATSPGVTITVNNTPPSVTITASPGSVVNLGVPVTYTAIPVKGGTAPSYQWKLNGVNVGTNSPTYANNAPVNGDVVSCIMTSNSTCANGAQATSNNITMVVNKVFLDKTAAVALSAYQNPRIIAVIDYNNDNYPDLFFRYWNGTAEQYTILKNNNGVYTNTGVSLNCPNKFGIFFDFNNDGYVDMATFSNDTLRIYQNNQGVFFSLYSTFKGITALSSAAQYEYDGQYGLYDYDNDGDLDFVYVSNTGGLNVVVNDYQNGNFNQNNVIIGAVNWPVNGSRFKMFDMDNDGDLDIVTSDYILGQAYSNSATHLFRNNGNGSFTDVSASSGIGASVAWAVCCILDINQDGKPDIIRGGPDTGTPPLYRVYINNGNGTFTDQTSTYAINPGNYFDIFNSVDFNNDARPDYNWSYYGGFNNCTAKLYRNNGGNSFSEVSASLAVNLGQVNGHCCPDDNFTRSVWLDYDNDGAMDNFISDEYWPTKEASGIGWMMKNTLGGHYLNIRLEGCKSNREGRGSKVVAKINGVNTYQYYVEGANMEFENSTSIFHFGLGNATSVDSVTVYWPSGVVSHLSNISRDTFIYIYEGHPGAINITSTPGDSICLGNSTVLNANGATSYVWAPSSGLNVITAGSVTASPTVTTTYIVTGTSSCGTTTSSVVVVVNPIPVIAVSGPTAICKGDSTTLTATGASNYKWSPDIKLNTTAGASVNASPTITTTYTITGSSSCGSSAEAAPLISTIAGNGTNGYNGDNIFAVLAKVGPAGVVLDDTGNVYFADYYNFRVRKIEHRTGIIRTIAGAGVQGFSGDGALAVNASLDRPIGITRDKTGNIFFADGDNNCIRKISPTGIITTVAGKGGVSGFSGDGGLAVNATMRGTYGVAVDAAGNIYLSDYINNRVRMVNTAGIINTIAGNGTGGYNGDEIAATSANLNNPYGLLTDVNGNVYICDRGNNRLRMIDKSGIIHTIAGTGSPTYNGDGILATNAAMLGPVGVALDNLGNIFIADENYRLREISALTGLISTIAGTGSPGYNGDGILATTAYIGVNGVAVDEAGNVYAGEIKDFRVRKISTNRVITFTTAVVTIQNLPAVSITGSGAVCGGKNVTLTASGASTYTWAPNVNLSATTGTIVTATPGVTTTYTITGTSACGTTTATSVITVNPLPSVTVSGITNICAGNNTTLTASGLSASYSWAPNLRLSTTSGSSVTANPTVTTTYTITGTNSCGTSSTTAVITVNPSPAVTISGTMAICNGGNTTLTASGSAAYSWAPNTKLSATAGASVTASPTVSTTYTITGTTTCGSTTATAVVTVNPQPQVSVSGATAICNGGNTTLTASGSATYSWAPNIKLSATAGASVTASPTVSTTYTITGTTTCGSTTATAVITVNPLPVVSISGNAAICNGKNAALTASGSATYSWAPNTNLSATTDANVTASPTTTTTYTITGSNTCGNTTGTTVITVNPLPAVSISGNTTICSGKNTSLTASGSGSYSWSPNTKLSTTTGASVTASPAVTTTYTITGTTACGSTTATAVITVNPLPTVSISGTTAICNGNNTTLTASGAATTYTWSPDVRLSATTGLSVTANPTVTTTYTITGTNSCGTSLATAVITVNNKAPIFTINGDKTICTGASTTLTLGGSDNYTWSPNVGLSSTTGPVVIANPVSSTTYTITGSNACGRATAKTLITVVPPPSISVSGTTTFCAGTGSTLTAQGAYSYNWSTGETTPSITANPAVSTTYTLTGKNSTGCSSSIQVPVTINPAPAITVTGRHDICSKDTTLLTAKGALTYKWNNNSTKDTLIVRPLTTAKYFVTGTDGKGCTATDTFKITVSICIGVNTVNGSTDNFIVYPNPTEDATTLLFTVNEGGKYAIKTMDVLGRVLTTENGNAIAGENSHTIHFNGLAKGVYIVLLQKGNDLFKAKVTLQ